MKSTVALLHKNISDHEKNIFNQWKKGTFTSSRLSLLNSEYFLEKRTPGISIVSGPRMLTELLTKMQMKRLEIYVLNHPEYSRYKLALAAAEFLNERVDYFLSEETSS